jgi:hypothetical protein
MKIGVVSDTHGYIEPQLTERLWGVDEILHAGDVGSQEVLDQLRAIAPVQAVRGNVDAAALELPLTLVRRYGDVAIHVQHELARPPWTLRDWAQAEHLHGKASGPCRRFLASFPPDCRVVIFGHSHEPGAVILQGRLFFNPGSAGRKRFSLPRCCGLLEITPEGVRATFRGLERYNEDLPEDTWLPMKGA